MIADDFNRITTDNLEIFLNCYKTKPLPKWFPTGNINFDYQDFNDGVILVKNIENRDYINHGLTVLPYIKGHLSYIEAGEVVISYPFSGCLMASFQFPKDSKKQYVSHIAKGDGAVEDKLCKWFAEDGDILKLCAFDPYDNIPIEKVQIEHNLLKYRQTVCYGIMTSDNKCYWFVVGTKEDDSILIDWGIVQKSFHSFPTVDIIAKSNIDFANQA